MDYNVQAERADKYKESSYITPRRWSSYAIQIREVMLVNPKRVLEIGPGNKIVTDILKNLGFAVETLDFDERLGPDHVGSITDRLVIKKLTGKFDLILACQIFEHLEYRDFLKTIVFLKEVTPKMIASLPFTEVGSKFFRLTMKVPGLRQVALASKIMYKPAEHRLDGEHYWEIGKKGYLLSKIKKDLKSCGWKIDKNFLNPDNPFHYFFVLSH